MSIVLRAVFQAPQDMFNKNLQKLTVIPKWRTIWELNPNLAEVKMFRKRFLELPENHSFFLFGPRGAGKSTLVKKQFDHEACGDL